VDAEFRHITIAASGKTSIKQALTAFFVNPNQTTYNGLKLYKYENGRLFDGVEIAMLEINAEFFASTDLGESSREAGESAQDLANAMRAANTYITAIRALNSDLAARVLRDSR
jgi:hypothetical protein